MIEDLRFVQGAIKKNSITPELEYYQIRDGSIISFNGYMALSSPIDLDLDAKPKAALFHKAIGQCGDSVAIHMTDAGRLSIRSGGFRALVPCTEKEVYQAEAAGDMYEAPKGIAACFKTMLPMVSEDASRPWAMGISFHNGCMTATNNIALYQVWTGHQMPAINCPRFAVAEIARIGIDPSHMQIDKHSLTFHWEDTGRWLRTQLLTDEWPAEMVDKLLDGNPDKNLQPIASDFFEQLARLKDFLPENSTAVRFEDGALTVGGDAEGGASVAVDGLEAGPVFAYRPLTLLNGIVEKVDFSQYPDPVPFTFGPSRGVILGLNA